MPKYTKYVISLKVDNEDLEKIEFALREALNNHLDCTDYKYDIRKQPFFTVKESVNKIIIGKRYDTDTATLICNVDNSDCIGLQDAPEEKWAVYYNGESLYRKTTGEFFRLIQEGKEALIEPLTEEDAKKWCEKYLSGNKYEEIFGKVEE